LSQLSSSLHVSGRARTIIAAGLALAAFLALAAWSPTARASGCTNTFKNTAGGSWFTAGNWSKEKVPSSTEEVCITEPGTYAVEMAQGPTVTVKTLTVGGASGTQTLAVESTSAANANLTTSEGLAIGAHGVVTMTNSADGDQNNVTLAGPITNAGTLASEKGNGAGGTRSIEGNFTNKGTFTVNKNTEFDGAADTLTNEGAINLAEAITLKVSDKSGVINGTGGKIAATGSADVVVMGEKTSFAEGAGTTSGTLPVIVDASALKYEGAGASVIAIRGASTLAGNLSSGQSLQIQSTSGENAHVTAAKSFSSAGSIALTNAADGDQNNAMLTIAKGETLTNSGTLASEFGNGAGGTRSIEGSVTNTGTFAVNKTTEYNGEEGKLTNEGALEVATGFALNVTGKNKLVNGTGGKIAGAGSGEVSVHGKETSFTQGAGTITGTLAVIVDESQLQYEGSGAGLIAIRGTSTLAGNLSAGQSLQVQSTSGENAHVTAAASFSSAGTIALTNAADGDQNNETLTVAKGETLTNSGSLSSEVGNGAGGTRTIEGNVANTGTLVVSKNTEYNGEGATLTNEGTLEVATERTLHVSNKGAVVNAGGGKIVAAGTGNVLVASAGTSFTEDAGTITGNLPVIVDDSALIYTGSGAGPIVIRGTSTLAGNLSAAQSLLLQSTSGENARVTAGASLSNAGSITLTNAADGDQNNQTLVIAKGATLTNSGTLSSEPGNGSGGTRVIEGALTNSGTLAINKNTEYEGELLNEGKIALANGVALKASGVGTVVVNGAGANIEGTGSGALSQHSGTFEEGAGKTTGTLPVVLDDLALKYTGNGASTIALRGTSTLSGPISTGQTLLLQSSSGENDNVSGASFTNSGKLVLQNASDGDANNVTLELSGGAGTLTNAKGATLEAEHGNGGTRTIEGSVVGEGTLVASANLKVSGNFALEGKKPLMKITIAGASSFGALAIGGTATIGGELFLVQVKPFVPTVGEKFVILSSSKLTGTFTKLKKNKIKKAEAKVYTPVYSPTAVTLEAQT
jgi:hypothetical protein